MEISPNLYVIPAHDQSRFHRPAFFPFSVWTKFIRASCPEARHSYTNYSGRHQSESMIHLSSPYGALHNIVALLPLRKSDGN